MLDKLIESKNNRCENRRLGGFLLSTFTAAAAVLTFALIYSLFAYNLALGGENLNLTALAAPVKIEEQTPPSEPIAEQNRQTTEKSISKLPTRRENIQSLDETPVKPPQGVSVTANQSMARPNSNFLIAGYDTNPTASGAGINERGNGAGNTGGIGKSLEQAAEVVKNEVEPPPVLKIEPKKVEPPKKLTTVSGGVVNGKAITLVKPEYSKAAQAIRADGEVKVQVTIDEDGSVVSASAVSGHPLLRAAAVNAARSSKFSPTFLSKQKVKVTGIIVYNFKQQ